MSANFKLSCIGLLLLVISFVAGCGLSGPAHSAAEGSVTIGGQPLSGGRIIFTPVAPSQGPAVSIRIAAGRYKASKAAGPVVGKNRVEVEADLALGFALDDEEAFARRGAAPLPASLIPPDFNTTAQLSVEIKPGEANKYDVTVPATTQTAGYR